METQPTAQQRQRFWQTRFFFSGSIFITSIVPVFGQMYSLFPGDPTEQVQATWVILYIGIAMIAYGVFRMFLETLGNYAGAGTRKQAKEAYKIWGRQTLGMLPVYMLGTAFVVALFHFFGTVNEDYWYDRADLTDPGLWLVYVAFVLVGSMFAQSIAHLIIIPPRSMASSVDSEEGSAR